MMRPKLGRFRESIRVVRNIASPSTNADTATSIEVIMLGKANVKQVSPQAQEGGGSDEAPNSTSYEFTVRVPTRGGRLPIESKQTIHWRGSSYRIQQVAADFYLGFVKILASLDENVINDPPTVIVLFGLDRLGTVATNGAGQCLTLTRGLSNAA